jgi:hypothetical protein
LDLAASGSKLGLEPLAARSNDISLSCFPVLNAQKLRVLLWLVVIRLCYRS